MTSPRLSATYSLQRNSISLSSLLTLGVCLALSPPAAAEANAMKNAYFGETHVHTAFSLDAYIGGARLTPDGAYRFAKGEEVILGTRSLRISRPLDFVAVTDHAEYIGEMYSTMYREAPGHNQVLLKELRSLKTIKEQDAWFIKYVVSSNRSTTPKHPPFYKGPETAKSAWKIILEAAERHNDPGTFTTIPAFEWSGAPSGGNLHRNVFFRDTVLPDNPISYIDVNREDGLWLWLREQEKKGSKVFAVPHNSNASKLMMFAPNDAEGDPIDLEYATLRSHFEPLVEMMQVKGNSEVHPKFWSADEFSNFENADSIQNYSKRTFSKLNFVRQGLIQGLSYEQSLGKNPFKYGTIGGTDSHNGTPSNVTENNYFGSHGGVDDTVEARRTDAVGGWITGRDLSPGGLAGVWAPENTRGAIWDAMYAKETFSTSGPRIKVRLFGGFGLADAGDEPKLLVKNGYANGVPMGGTLTARDAKGAKQPTFNVWAMKDAEQGNLDRIQIIKGWVTVDGEMNEKIINVSWSDGRKLGADGKLPPVGNTVDLKHARYTNDIGSPELMGSWTDMDFDSEQHALYYVRVLQIPTPRWTTYDAVRNDLPLLTDVPATIQERAWSSPVWYNPKN